MTPQARLRRIRYWLVFFIVGLVLSGVTAFPLVTELRWVDGLLHESWVPAPDALVDFIGTVRTGVETADRDFPFLAYGTDWLAFAHLVIAMAFYGPLRDPVRNLWVIHWGMLCCVAVVPLALIAAPIRGLPWWWIPIDISFGLFGIIPLLIIRRHILALAATEPAPQTTPAPTPTAV
ncbi:hypothetical protein [Catellatospora citrea]|uniref:Cytoplasmic membrane protein n=1 Tax=Catellatospora citrea TaxID=53366 RepID=A0A8J3P3W0_9ACTN|nr:hypothetical protein [Catellatospora citrea]RKE09887.1 hypothetical protein C8E86_4781 [Catellatospora citrea]GIG02762.1 hypothetical protein Cci01nite_78550 [Catellatospora citrea]